MCLNGGNDIPVDKFRFIFEAEFGSKLAEPDFGYWLFTVNVVCLAIEFEA